MDNNQPERNTVPDPTSNPPAPGTKKRTSAANKKSSKITNSADQQPIPTTRAPRAPRKRPIDELDKLSAKQMTPDERIVYIDAARNTMQTQMQRFQSMADNAEKAYEQYKNADAAYRKVTTAYKADLTQLQAGLKTLIKLVDTLILTGGNI
jgi:flagellin-like hook-associated protein FlgL